jgi:hypothetical protein
LELDEQERMTGQQDDEGKRAMVTRVINRWTTLPEPTREDWVNATATDHDLTRISAALATGDPLSKAALHDKTYHKEWSNGKLELDDGVLYQYEEPKATRIRQLRRRVVPTRLRDLIITAYHATPMAGHTGYY